VARRWTGAGIWRSPLAEERLTALQSQGIELAFSNIPMNNDNLARLDPIRPVFISCQLTQSPLYWNLLSQCLHASGYTLLAEAGDVSDVDMLRSWGIDGYATQENAS
jgi:hypothetical protein